MSDELTDTVDGNETVTGELDRREFLKRVGGGVVVMFTTGPAFFSRLSGTASSEAAGALDYNAYLRIGTDGRVTCFVGKIEMGQGVVTSLAQMLADELDVALESVDMVMGDTDLCPYDRGTWGSLSTRVFGPELRAAGAMARAALLDLAAERLGVRASRLEVDKGVVRDKQNPKSQVTYGALTEGKQITREVTRDIAVKAVVDFKVMGHSFARRDGRSKVTGAAKYAADIRVPGMLVARILRPPAHGRVLLKLDTSAAEAVEGVQVVRIGELVAVLHLQREVADAALAKVKATFDTPKAAVDENSIFDHLVSVASPARTISEKGDVNQGARLSAQMSQSRYLNGYVAHAPMEPHAALAEMKDGRMTVWASTQTPFGVRDEVARTLNMPTDKVHVITPFVGGAFGGKSANRQAVEAARLAARVGKPVQVAWSREEEFFNDTFRPASVVQIRSGVTKSGGISFWDYQVDFAGPRGSENFYNVAHERIRSAGGAEGAHPFATGAWRAPGANMNVFARESQIDVLASMAGIDPLEFRLKNLTDERLKGVLRAAAKRFRWRTGKAPTGHGFGVACGVDSDTAVAVMARLRVDKSSGHVQVQRIVCAQDMGLVINPDGARMQIEGCLTMGLGYALTEEIHFTGGAIHDLNFGTYQLPLFSWLPEIETILVDSGDHVPHGGGEPAIVVMGAVIANAIFDATGVRLYQMPMTPERILEAIAHQ